MISYGLPDIRAEIWPRSGAPSAGPPTTAGRAVLGLPGGIRGRSTANWMTVHGSSAISGHQNSPRTAVLDSPVASGQPRPTGVPFSIPRSHPGEPTAQRSAVSDSPVASASRPPATKPVRDQSQSVQAQPGRRENEPDQARRRSASKFGIAGSSVASSMTVRSPLPAARGPRPDRGGSGAAGCGPRRPSPSAPYGSGPARDLAHERSPAASRSSRPHGPADDAPSPGRSAVPTPPPGDRRSGSAAGRPRAATAPPGR